MTTSRVPQIVDQVLSLTTPGLQALGALVVDGPETVNLADQTIVFVGATTVDTPIEVTQTWAGQGSHRRNETVQLPCQIAARDGGIDMAVLRVQAFALLQVFEQALVDNPTLGIDGTTRAHLTDVTASQLRTERGAVVIVTFTVTVESRLAP